MRVVVVVLVIVLFGRRCCLVGPRLDVAQGILLEFLLGYSPSEVSWGNSDVAAFH